MCQHACRQQLRLIPLGIRLAQLLPGQQRNCHLTLVCLGLEAGWKRNLAVRMLYPSYLQRSSRHRSIFRCDVAFCVRVLLHAASLRTMSRRCVAYARSCAAARCYGTKRASFGCELGTCWSWVMLPGSYQARGRSGLLHRLQGSLT